MRALFPIALLLALVGCAEKPEPLAEPPKEEQVNIEQAGSSQESVNVVSPAAGLSSPVTGSDSVTGSGSGVGQAAKDQAKKASSGGSSLDGYSDN